MNIYTLLWENKKKKKLEWDKTWERKESEEGWGGKELTKQEES